MSTITPMLLFQNGTQVPVWKYVTESGSVSYGQRTIREGFLPKGAKKAFKFGFNTEPSLMTVLENVVVPKGQKIHVFTPYEGFIEQDSWFAKL